MKRLGIFVFFDKEGIVDRYIEFMLKDVSRNVDHLVIVCNGFLRESGREILQQFTDKIYVRSNVGFDAGAYKDAILVYVSLEEIRKYDELLLLNDTFYGPFYSFKEIFKKMQFSKTDAWGITKHQRFKWNGKIRNEHIQTYFLVIRKKVLDSEIFCQYWEKLRYPQNKEEAITDFELRFSQLMLENGFLIDAVYDGAILEKSCEDLEKKFEMPIIKRNILLQLDYVVDEGVKILSHAEEKYKYDLRLIYENLSRHCSYEGILGYLLHRECLSYRYKNRIDSVRWRMREEEKKMKSVVIWGMGRIFQNEIPYLSTRNVVAIVDNQKCNEMSEWNGIPVIPETRLSDYQCKKVVVFTTRYYDVIKTKLFYEHNIQAKDILSWSFYSYYREEENEWMCRGALDIIIDCAVQKGFDSFNDGFNRLIDYGFVTKAANWKVKDIYACKYYENKIYDNLYDCKYVDSDLILYIDPFTKYSPDAFVDKVINEADYAYIMFNVPEVGYTAYLGWAEYDFEALGEIEYIPNKFGKVVYLKKTRIPSGKDICTYVVTHKKFNIPDLDDSYKCIQAGAELNENLGYLRDNEGDHISDLNPYLNECTAIYWAWKNDKESKLIGINHYRRYFRNREGNIIGKNEIINYLKKYDILLGERNISYPRKVKEVMSEYVDDNAYDEGFRLITEMMKKKCPDDLDVFLQVMEDYAFYSCNMFITSREIFDEYCEWLFDIILDASAEFNLENFDKYSQRMIGFFAERLLSVWIMKHHYKIKELPILYLE